LNAYFDVYQSAVGSNRRWNLTPHAYALEIDFGQIDKFESLGRGTLEVGAAPKVIVRGNPMGRPAYGARTACESRKSIDVRRWHREGRFSAGQYFTCSWSRSGAMLAALTSAQNEMP
jgi:hypothetical protein